MHSVPTEWSHQVPPRAPSTTWDSGVPRDAGVIYITLPCRGHKQPRFASTPRTALLKGSILGPGARRSQPARLSEQSARGTEDSGIGGHQALLASLSKQQNAPASSDRITQTQSTPAHAPEASENSRARSFATPPPQLRLKLPLQTGRNSS